MSASVRENSAGNDLDPVNEDKTPNTASEMQAMAELAEAEAAEAEALAASARARARAIRLRRRAALAEASEPEEAQMVPAASELGDSQPDSASEDVSLEGETKNALLETNWDESARERDTTVSSDAPPGTELDEPTSYRRWRHHPRLSTVATILTIVAIVGSLAGTIYMVLVRHNASQQHQQAAEFAAAARQGVMTLTSLDFNNAKRDVQRILDNSTGSFKADIQKMADDFVKSVEESKVVEQGAVESVAVDLDSVTKDSAVVLVASKSDVTNAAGAKQDPRDFRLIVTMVRDGGQLKMSKVQFVP
jgi:Mce-associated membrane protein